MNGVQYRTGEKLPVLYFFIILTIKGEQNMRLFSCYKFWRGAVLISLISVLLISLAGCGANTKSNQAQENGQEIVVTDSLNRTIRLNSPAQRIISLSPATTEIMYAIGAEKQLIGDAQYCDYPAAAKKLKKYGSFDTINAELVVAAKPDLVLLAAGVQENFLPQLEQAGLKVVVMDAHNLNQIWGNIRLAGKVSGNDQAANALAGKLSDRVSHLAKLAAATKNRPGVFFEVWPDPLMTAGDGTFISNLIDLAGGHNIADGNVKGFGQFSRESLVAANPDIYLLSSHGDKPESLQKRSGFTELGAVKHGRIHIVDDDLVTLPGPRIVDGLAELVKIIHPELKNIE